MRRLAAVIGAAAVIAAPSCRGATEILVHATTDAPCAQVSAGGTIVSTRTPGAATAGNASAPTTSCDQGGEIGTLVLVPRDAKDARVRIDVVTSMGRPVAQCDLAQPQADCIVARRLLRFLPHEPLWIDVPVRAACAGKSCDADQTCVEGACVGAEIDPNRCLSPGGCDETLLGGANDGGAPDGAPGDGGAPDAASTSDAPADAPPPPGVTQLTAHAAHTCALLANGAVRCWGDNLSGDVGDGTTTQRNVPTDVLSLGGAVSALGAGYDATYALLANGGVQGWGSLAAPQLSPSNIGPFPDAVIEVAGGNSFACAVTATGRVACWGVNTTGQLGDGTTSAHASPAPVLNLVGASHVSTGGSHACAVLGAGGIVCWGDNSSGQLGDGTPTATPHTLPLPVLLGEPAKQVAAGGFHTCALLTTGAVKCWGSGEEGELGNGMTSTTSAVPVDVNGLGPGSTLQLATNGGHTCALLASGGGIRCWGNNPRGQLGNGSVSLSSTPVDVKSLGGAARQVIAGDVHTCALLTAGGVRCWGDNSYGELGDGTTTTRLVPVGVVGFP